MRQSIKHLLSVGLVLLLTACGGGSGSGGTDGGGSSSTRSLIGIDLIADNTTLDVGDEANLTVLGIYSDGTASEITNHAGWLRNGTSVTDVDVGPNSAKVTATGAGDSVITASINSGAFTDTVTFSVTDNTLKSINVTPYNPTLAKGTKINLTATGNYGDGSTQTLTTTQVNWTSTNESVAIVNSSGRVTVAANPCSSYPCTVRIVANKGKIVGSVLLTIKNVTLTSISINAPTYTTMAAGTKQRLTAIGTFSDASTQDLTDQVTWSPSNNASSVLDVSNSLATAGVVTAKLAGPENVTATVGVMSSAPQIITVSPANITGISVSLAPATIVVGQTRQLTATASFDDDSTQNVTDQVTWSQATGGTGAVTINSSGQMTGDVAGSATVEATLLGETGTSVITVVTAPATPVSLTIQATPNVIYKNGSDSTTLTITVQAADGTQTSVPNTTVVDLSYTSPCDTCPPTSVNTTNGVNNSVTITSSTPGVIVVTASIGGTIQNTTPILVVDSFAEILAVSGHVIAGVIDTAPTPDMIKKGASIRMEVYNLSNQDFGFTEFEFGLYTPGTDTIAAPEIFSETLCAKLFNCFLKAGVRSTITLVTDNDISIPSGSTFASRYHLNHPQQGNFFVTEEYTLSEFD